MGFHLMTRLLECCRPETQRYRLLDEGEHLINA